MQTISTKNLLINFSKSRSTASLEYAIQLAKVPHWRESTGSSYDIVRRHSVITASLNVDRDQVHAKGGVLPGRKKEVFDLPNKKNRL